MDSTAGKEILVMLPAYYDADNTRAVLDTQGKEFDALKSLLLFIIDQIFAETASGWGLARWEKDLDITPAAGDSEELRRARILARLLAPSSMTKIKLEQIINQFVPGAAVAKILDEYAFYVNMPLDGLILISIRDIFITVDENKPAHLEAVYQAEASQSLELKIVTENAPVVYSLCNMERTAALAGVALQLSMSLGVMSRYIGWEYSPCGTVQTAGQPGQGCFASLDAGANVVTKAWEYDLAGEAMPAGDKGYPLAGGMSLETIFVPVSWGYEMCGQITARSDAA
ncbi:putative phage tail protein [Pelotomaculum propionicicum]|uniref:Uncharacterized protein n=1 Tax=Pelotomaculum propionicicum TaxID=258475 RepID=A0A4Y7RJX5_9FIRM|nr:putative phage tail protein [Pelotomaculum propionicicum]TEB09294.1 hypothetical protein Pmgp_03226 [Pelotomaculum propionicicum]